MGHLKARQERLHSQPLSISGSASSQPGQRYRYTLEGCMLSPADRQFYEENGFLVVKGLVGKDQLAAYEDRFRRICKKEVKVGERSSI